MTHADTALLDRRWAEGLAEFDAGFLGDPVADVASVVARRRRRRRTVSTVVSTTALALFAGLALVAFNPPDSDGGALEITDASTTPSTARGRGHAATPTPAPERNDENEKQPEVTPLGSRSRSRGSESVSQFPGVDAGPATGTTGRAPETESRPHDPTAPTRSPDAPTVTGPPTSNPPPVTTPPVAPIANVVVTLDDAGLHSSVASVAGDLEVTIAFVDQRTDNFSAVMLESQPSRIQVGEGTVRTLDLRVLRTYELRVEGTGATVPLTIVEPTLNPPSEPENTLTVEVRDGKLILPHRDVRFGQPVPRFGNWSETPKWWTSVHATSLLLRVLNPQNVEGTVRVDHGTIVHLQPGQAEKTTVVALEPSSPQYNLQLGGAAGNDEVIIWRAGAGT